MKIYLSADIEGTCGIVDWSETILENELSNQIRNQMTKEVSEACDAAGEVAAKEVLVKDAGIILLHLQMAIR